MRSFREKKIRVLIATDIASRGLDVPHLKHVINYDLPQVAEDYIHRIGRTARAGESGEAICFVSPSEGHLWLNIDMLMNPNAKHQYAPRKNTSSRSRRRKAGSSNGKSFSDKPKRKSKAGPSKRTIRSSDAKPKKRFYAAKKKSKK